MGFAKVIIAFVLLSLHSACAPAPGLKTEGASAVDVSGTYTVILYGCNYLDDLETVAILDREGDRTTIEPYAPAFQFRRLPGVPAKEALTAAEQFFHCSTSYRRSQLLKITGRDGAVAGYEMRPLYLPYAYGTDEVIETFYRTSGDRILVTVRLKPSVQDVLDTDGSADNRD